MLLVKKLLSNNLSQRGDTIVEVLMAIVVISTMLGGAFVVANKSLLASRDSQERSVAIKLTESQMERIKMLSSSNPDAIFSGANPFCVKQDNTVVGSADAGCSVDADGSPSSTTPFYRISITRDGITNTFTVATTWEKTSGGGDNTLRMYYKVYR